MSNLPKRMMRKISIEAPPSGRDAIGGVSGSWTPVATKIWASVADLSGRELIAAQAVQSQVETTILIRHPRDRFVVDATMRVLHKGTIYNIETALDKEGFGRWLWLSCSKGLNDG